jgi:hypothetical protein
MVNLVNDKPRVENEEKHRQQGGGIFPHKLLKVN